MKKTRTNDEQTLVEARDEFVTQWGTIGTAWGINRTMAQVHALLITTDHLMSTDQPFLRRTATGHH